MLFRTGFILHGWGLFQFSLLSVGFYVEIIHSAAIAVGDAKTPVPTQTESGHEI